MSAYGTPTLGAAEFDASTIAAPYGQHAAGGNNFAATGAGAGAGGGASGMQITFAPNITITGGANAGEVQAAMKLSFAEFEALMKQYETRTQRRGYQS